MTKEIVFILACVPLYVVNSFCDKWVSSKSGNKYNYMYNCIKFFICSICLAPMLFIDKSRGWATGCLLCGFMCGIMYAVSKTVILKGYERTSIAYMTLCHSSGMILPCILGYFFWGEDLSAFSVIGILLAIFSIVLLKGEKTKNKGFDFKGIIFGVIIFSSSAGVMVTQKLMGIYFSSQSVSAYNFYSFIIAFLILCFFIRPKQVQGMVKEEKKLIFLCGLGSAISLSFISFVMTKLAGAVPSIILFPLFNGLGIIFVCIGSAFVFKESLTRKKTTGLIIGVLGLCLVNF